MKSASCIIIGSEILRGDITDRHVSFLANQLKILGFGLEKSTIVPDDYSINSVLDLDLKNYDLVITTGGLGPTSDDITRKSVAMVTESPLEKNDEVFLTLLKKLDSRAFGANEVQAMIPSGFTVLPNPNGTAVGFIKTVDYKNNNVTLVCLPGPPVEMQDMFLSFVVPFLKKYDSSVNLPDSYTVFLISEAKLEELCQMASVNGVSWGTRFSQYSVNLYVYGDDKKNRDEFIDNLRNLVGPYLIYESDNVNASELLTDYLKKNHLTISCAESCTSGLIAKLLTDKSGSSDYFWGGVASYHNNAKIRILSVPKEVIDKYSPVSEETAKAMVLGINTISNTSVSISTTGYADERATLCLGFKSNNNEVQTVKIKFSIKDRDLCRRRYAVCALILCRLYLCYPKLNLSEITKLWTFV